MPRVFMGDAWLPIAIAPGGALTVLGPTGLVSSLRPTGSQYFLMPPIEVRRPVTHHTHRALACRDLSYSQRPPEH